MKHAATATRRIQCKDSVTRRRHGTALRSLPDRLEVELRHPLTELAPESESILAGAAEMDAGIDPGVSALPRRLRKARERSGDPLERLYRS